MLITRTEMLTGMLTLITRTWDAHWYVDVNHKDRGCSHV